MSKQMITFSFRTTPEAVRTLKEQAWKRKTSCGALLREMIKQIREEANESKTHPENDRVDDGIGMTTACNPITRPGSGSS